MNDREYFDSVAYKWDSMISHNSVNINALLDNLPSLSGARVLDVGSGTGVLIPYLLQRNAASITALDISANMLSISAAKHSHPAVRFVCEDALEFKDGQYDAVLCYSMFPHFSDQQKAILHLSTLLSVRGCLAVMHSQSRDAINALHGGMQSRPRLPESTQINHFLSLAGLIPRPAVDSDIFLCSGIKI